MMSRVPFILFVLFAAPASSRAPSDPPPRPVLEDEQGFPGPDRNVAVEGRLVAPFCFRAPVEVCLPAQSRVWFTVHAADAPVFRAARASAPFEAMGLRFAAHRAPEPSEAGSEWPEHSLELLGAGTVRGLLDRAAEVAGRWIAPGPVELRRDGAAAVEAVLGELARPAPLDGWSAPAGARFDLRNAPGSVTLSLSARASRDARFTRVPDRHWPGEARAVARWQDAGGTERVRLQLSTPWELAGTRLHGTVLLARPAGSNEDWSLVEGARSGSGVSTPLEQR